MARVQADAPLAIRPMLPHLTKSEIHAVMTAGFATIAGSVLAAYISFGVSVVLLLSFFFSTLLAASSSPAVPLCGCSLSFNYNVSTVISDEFSRPFSNYFTVSTYFKLIGVVKIF